VSTPQLIATSAPQGASVGAMYRALVGIASACGLLIVSVFLLTEPVIRANRAAQLEAAVFTVVPGAVSKRSFRYAEGEGLLPAESGSDPLRSVHAAYDDGGRLLGIAIPGRAMGYADFIDALYGYDPQAQQVIGLKVLASKETPGLGDKIEKDADFVANFSALDVRLDATGSALAHPPVAVANGARSEPWQIDGITGATISSKAIAMLLRESAALWLPRLQLQRDVLEAAGAALQGEQQ
jgi:electron transport complex protein RnfG